MRCYASVVLAIARHVCLYFVSVTCTSSIKTAEQIQVILAWEFPFAYPTLCYEESLVPAVIKGLSPKTLSQTLDLENFTTAHQLL